MTMQQRQRQRLAVVTHLWLDFLARVAPRSEEIYDDELVPRCSLRNKVSDLPPSTNGFGVFFTYQLVDELLDSFD